MSIPGVAAIIVMLYLALTATVYLSQRSLLYHPDNTIGAPSDYGGDKMQALITEDPEKRVHWYGKGPHETAPVIVFFHGNAGHMGYRVFKTNFLMSQGYGVLLVGYRGYGTNSGSPTEQGLYEDARSALNTLISQGITNSQIILYGESLGTGVAVQMAAEGYGSALILEASYTDMAELAFHHYPIFPVSLLLKDRYSSIEKIGKIQMPKLFLHGERDEIIPMKFGSQLFDAAPEPKIWKNITTAGHNDLFEHGAATIIAEFLSQHIPVIRQE